MLSDDEGGEIDEEAEGDEDEDVSDSGDESGDEDDLTEPERNAMALDKFRCEQLDQASQTNHQ